MTTDVTSTQAANATPVSKAAREGGFAVPEMNTETQITELLKRVEALEQRVADLEARPHMTPPSIDYTNEFRHWMKQLKRNAHAPRGI